MSQTVTLNLPDETFAWLEDLARQAGRPVGEVGADVFAQARRTSALAGIEFRTFGGERLACLVGGVRVWKIVLTAQEYGMDAAKTAAHFGLALAQTETALRYHAAFPAEIDAAIAQTKVQTFDTLKQILPDVEHHEVSG